MKYILIVVVSTLLMNCKKEQRPCSLENYGSYKIHNSSSDTILVKSPINALIYRKVSPNQSLVENGPQGEISEFRVLNTPQYISVEFYKYVDSLYYLNSIDTTGLLLEKKTSYVPTCTILTITYD